MAIQVYKVNLTGYLIRNTEVMDDPNNIALDTVMEMVLDSHVDCTIDLIDSIGDTGCGCTECTCGAKPISTPLIVNLQDGDNRKKSSTSADTADITTSQTNIESRSFLT
jgi:hypothetical protein